MDQLLDPSVLPGSVSKSRSRSGSPAGTKRKATGSNREDSSAKLFLSKPDQTVAEEHELVDIASSQQASPFDALSINISGSSDGNCSQYHERETTPKDFSVIDQQAAVLRDRSRTPTAPRADTSDSEDRYDARSSVWSQRDTHVPNRNLSTFDVAALIFNKMVGTGIFTAPIQVLSLTGSKPLSVGLWAIGGLYTLICMFIYLEYGIALPFTGGEVIYLDEIFHRPRALATMIFSGFFLFLANSTGNSLVFSKHVLSAAIPESSRTEDFDERLVRFIAITILTTICLLHYFSSKLGLFLNKLVALFKVCLLFSVFVAGVVASRRLESGRDDWYDKHGPDGHTNRADSLAASVIILYAYQGWENANYVAGEIEMPDKYLKRGAFLAVTMVTLLYVLVATAFYMACDYATIKNTGTDLGMAILFGPKVFGGTGLGLKVLIALSAVGNLIAVTYTSSKVKQAIARQGFIPFHEFFAENWTIAKGGLIMHWFTTMIMIAFTPNTADGYAFVVGIFTYCHLIFAIVLAAGTFWLRRRMQKYVDGYQLHFLNQKPVLAFTVFVFIGMNFLALFFGAKRRTEGAIPRYWWPIVFAIITAASCLYWFVFWCLQQRINRTNTTVGAMIGLEVKMYDEQDEDWPDDMKGALAQVRLDGTRRRTQYKYHGPFRATGDAYRTVKDRLGEWFF